MILHVGWHRRGSSRPPSAWRSMHSTRLVMHRMFRLRATGAEQLPAAGAFVITANHVSDLDAMAIAAALPWSRFRRLYWAGDVVRCSPTRFLASFAGQCMSFRSMRTIRARPSKAPGGWWRAVMYSPGWTPAVRPGTPPRSLSGRGIDPDPRLRNSTGRWPSGTSSAGASIRRSPSPPCHRRAPARSQEQAQVRGHHAYPTVH